MARETKSSRLKLQTIIMTKKIFLLIVLMVVTVSTFSQSFEFSNSHTAFHVKDVNKSAEFYLNILKIDEMDTPEGMPDTIRWFYLSDTTQIHLIQSEDLVKIPKGIHISIATSQLEAVIAHLEENKIPFENWFGDKNTTNTRGDGIKQIYVQDVDGYWIEINDDVK